MVKAVEGPFREAPAAGLRLRRPLFRLLVALLRQRRPRFEKQLSKKVSPTYAVEGLLELIKGDYAKGVETLGRKTADEVKALNAQFAPKEESDGEQW